VLAKSCRAAFLLLFAPGVGGLIPEVRYLLSLEAEELASYLSNRFYH
jgi:hypothetical protein